MDSQITLTKSFQLWRKIFGIQAEHNQSTSARQNPAAGEGDPQVAGSTPRLFEGLKGAALESGPGALAKHRQGHCEPGAGQCCPAETTCVAESPSLHRTHLQHSGCVSKDSGRVPCLGFQSRALPFQHSSCALAANLPTQRAAPSASGVCCCIFRAHINTICSFSGLGKGGPSTSDKSHVSCLWRSPSGSVPGLGLSAAPVPGYRQQPGGGSARLLLSCEVTGAGLNQLFDPQTLDTHSHITHILCEPQRGRN